MALQRKRGAGSSNTPSALVRVIAPTQSEASVVHRGLVQHGTRTGVANMLSDLHKAGLLHESALGGSVASVRRKLRIAMDAHGKSDTPYGTLIKTMELGNGIPRWDYCDPLALMSHLSEISPTFFRNVIDSSEEGRPMRLVLYVDECEPGNPLRPESERGIQCIYWTFADFPAWLLARTNAWFTFGFLRSVMCKKLPGGLSELMSRVLQIFLPPTGHSFSRGVIIHDSQSESSHVLTAIFGGFLADESAHKYIMGSKGASGTPGAQYRMFYARTCIHTHIAHMHHT